MRISHVILRVRDMDRALDFYDRAVGLPVLSSAPDFSFLDGESIRVALHRSDMASESNATETVLEVEDVDQVHREMSSRGVPFEVDPRPVMEVQGRRLRAAHFRDPDGHLWSITAWDEQEG